MPLGGVQEGDAIFLSADADLKTNRGDVTFTCHYSVFKQQKVQTLKLTLFPSLARSTVSSSSAPQSSSAAAPAAMLCDGPFLLHRESPPTSTHAHDYKKVHKTQGEGLYVHLEAV